MTCGIYCITNLLNGKQYVGQSIHIEQRFKEHCQKNAKLIIDKAIQKYGKSNFTFEILEECPNEFDILNEKEIYWIEKLGTFNNQHHYNYTKGGKNAEHLVGNIQSNDTRNKISNKVNGKKNGMCSGKPTISKNGFVNGEQQYVLRYLGKIIARSKSIKRLEQIRDCEDWDNLNTPKVSLIKDGTTQGMQKYTVMYKKKCLKTSCDLDKAKKFFKLAQSKLEGEDRSYYEKNLHEVIPCRKYTFKSPDDLNNVNYSECKCRLPTNDEKIKMSKKLTNSGIYRVAIEKNRLRYVYKDIVGKKRSFCSVNAQKLKQKVLDNGLEWIVLDEEKAKENGLL